MYIQDKTKISFSNKKTDESNKLERIIILPFQNEGFDKNPFFTAYTFLQINTSFVMIKCKLFNYQLVFS